MRIVIQRVTNSSVKVSGKIVGEISGGLLVLVGVGNEDSEEDVGVLVKKLVKLRILADDEDKMNLSLLDKKQSVLAISQFTLYADTSKGNRPSFIKAADPVKAKKLYELFVSQLKSEGVPVETGEFGAYMDINAKLDGPVTIILDSKD